MFSKCIAMNEENKTETIISNHERYSETKHIAFYKRKLVHMCKHPVQKKNKWTGCS